MKQSIVRLGVGLLVLALGIGGLAGEAAAQAVRTMYWTNGGIPKIQRANLDGSGIEDLVTGGFPFGLALDVAGGKMYWTDTVTHKIQRANLDGSRIEELVTEVLSIYLALDVAGGKMYWTNGGTPKIQRANLDGSGVEDLVTGLLDPIGIALDLAGHKMYWTDYLAHKIQRANLDGSGIEDLVTQVLPWELALDVAGGKMYWIYTSIVGKIQRANLDGSGVEDVVTHLYHSFAIALDVAAGKLYWDDLLFKKIKRANLDGSGIEDVVTTPATDAIALDLTVGGRAHGVQPTKVVCKNITTGQHVKITLAPGVRFWDCASAGLTVNTGDLLKMVVPGSAFKRRVGGRAHGFQPTKVVCKDITTGQRVKITRGPGFLSWDCTEAGLVVQVGDSLRMRLTGSE
jgi:outer membrane protein assembly factor BamB